MKRNLFFLLVLLLPVITIESLLHVNPILNSLLLNNRHMLIWNEAERNHVWSNTLIMGSSFVVTGVDPNAMNQVFKKNKAPYVASSIAIYGDETSVDYFNLMRVLSTCKQCPSTIIYGVNDVEVKKVMVKQWQDITTERIGDLYFNNTDLNSSVVEASDIDQEYRYVFRSIMQKELFKLYFIGDRVQTVLQDIFFSTLLKLDPNKHLFSHDTYANQGLVTGFTPQYATMTKGSMQYSLAIYKDHLNSYSVGGGNVLFLDKLLQLAKKKHVQVYIFMSPLSSVYLKTFNKEEIAYKEIIRTEANRYNFDYFDDTAFMNNDLNMFTDVNHLSYLGSQIFSRHLAEEVLSKEKTKN